MHGGKGWFGLIDDAARDAEQNWQRGRLLQCLTSTIGRLARHHAVYDVRGHSVVIRSVKPSTTRIAPSGLRDSSSHKPVRPFLGLP